jgi:hypothetical protein
VIRPLRRGRGQARPAPVADAVSALVNLGYGQPQAAAAIAAAARSAGEGADAARLIRLGLKGAVEMSARKLASKLSKPDQELIEAARQAIIARYKNDWQEVGAAMRTRDGRIVTGVNLDAYLGRMAVCAEGGGARACHHRHG